MTEDQYAEFIQVYDAVNDAYPGAWTLVRDGKAAEIRDSRNKMVVRVEGAGSEPGDERLLHFLVLCKNHVLDVIDRQEESAAG